MATGPTVGRIVHYRSYGTPGHEYDSECRAAVVTEVVSEGLAVELEIDPEKIGLAVLNPTGMFFNREVEHDENKRGGTWHWPCVVTGEDA